MIKDVCFNDPRSLFSGVGTSVSGAISDARSREYKTVEAAKRSRFLDYPRRQPRDGLIEVLQNWRSLSDFKADDDWVWASSWVAGSMPLYTNAIQRDYLIPAGERAGLGKIGWHTLRHTYRSWLDQTKAPMTRAEGPDAARGHQDHDERVR